MPFIVSLFLLLPVLSLSKFSFQRIPKSAGITFPPGPVEANTGSVGFGSGLARVAFCASPIWVGVAIGAIPFFRPKDPPVDSLGQSPQKLQRPPSLGCHT